MAYDLKYKTPLFYYTEEELAKILESRGRKPDGLAEDIEIIRKWLKTQSHLPMQPTDRQIISFLVMNKFSIEKTKEKLELNYSIKSLIPEFYKFPVSHTDFLKDVNCNTLVYLPKLNKNLNRVVIWKPDIPEDFNVNTLFSTLLQLLELKSILDFSNSDEYMCDLSNLSLSLVSKIGPMDIKKMLTILEKVYSNRIAAIHYVNIPSYAMTLINLVKVTLKPKIRDRIVLHKNNESLLDYYSKDILPKDLGGNSKSLAELKEDFKQLLLDNQEYLKKVQSARVNEVLRPAKLCNDDILGFHGNFRKLQVD